MNGFFMSLACPTAAEAKRAFDVLSPSGSVMMPLDKTFWAEAFAMLIDRFGTPWMINGAMAPV